MLAISVCPLVWGWNVEDGRKVVSNLWDRIWMKVETKEDPRSDITVSGVLYNQYTFWRKASAIVFVSNEVVRI